MSSRATLPTLPCPPANPRQPPRGHGMLLVAVVSLILALTLAPGVGVSPIIIGVCGGDGIGPYITEQAQRILEHLLESEVSSGKVGQSNT